MTTTTATYGMAGLIRQESSTAQSAVARRLDRMHEETRRRFLDSYAMSSKAEKSLGELEEVSLEALCEGWDGHGALPMDMRAYLFAKKFLHALPTTAPAPEVSADTDGEVSLDWIFGNHRALTVSIGPTGRCTFAWMLGKNTNRGTGWIEDEIPATIVFALGQLARDASVRQAS
jgi:hypothetical protein